MEQSIALVRACAERLKASALAAGGKESELPLSLGARVLERSVAKDEGQKSRETEELH